MKQRRPGCEERVRQKNAGSTRSSATSAALEGGVPELYAIGDCSEPGMIVDAVAAGWPVAKEI
ncbi:MAG: hypothetical protein LLG45_12160 [Actinomycetia bacterium]|nr:hypothetical protein [Actinomycetes bacterium]